MRLAKLTKRLGLRTMTTASALATLVACGGGNAPELSGLSDQVAQVGTEFKLDLNGTDPDGDRLSYDFRAADLDGVKDRAMVTVSPSGAGVFRWTPLAADVGQHAFDFIVSDGGNDKTVTINIDVKSAIGSATAPIFRQPLGTGTTIDLGKNAVHRPQHRGRGPGHRAGHDQQQEPLIEGATLEQMDGQTAKWHWCPTRAQEGDTRYTLVLSANDGENPKTIKNYSSCSRGTTEHELPGRASGHRTHLVESDDAPRPQADREHHGRQGPQGRAAVLLLVHEPRHDAGQPVADDAADDHKAVGHATRMAPGRRRAEPGCERRGGHDEDDLLRVRRRR